MKRSSIRAQIWIITALLTALAPRFARGDGGIIRLRQVQGPFSVTVFTSPEASRVGLADVSVLVQWWETGEVVLDADVGLTLNPPKGAATKQLDPLCGLPWTLAAVHNPVVSPHPMTVRATREQASNKLLYAAPVELNAAGDWQMHVHVSRGADNASFDCVLPVALASSDLKGLWPFLALVPIVIIAFGINQWLRWRSLAPQSRPANPRRHPPISPVMPTRMKPRI
jgi:hypothetical protein